MASIYRGAKKVLEPADGGDNIGYVLNYPMNDYPNQPAIFRFDHNTFWKEVVWSKAGSSLTSKTVPAYVIQKDKPFPSTGVGAAHPSTGNRWDAKSVPPLTTVEFALEQSITEGTAVDPVLAKTASNLTTQNIKDNYPGDEINYVLDLDVNTDIDDGALYDSLPDEVSAPTKLVLETTSNGTPAEIIKKDLEVADYYDEGTHSIEVPVLEDFRGKVKLSYTVKLLDSAENKKVKNDASLINGTDITGKEIKDIVASYEINVKPVPYGTVTVTYENEADKGKDIADKEELKELLSQKILDHAEKKDIAGYVYSHASDNMSGVFTKEHQTVTFYYKEARFNLIQNVYGQDGQDVDKDKVKNNQELTYKLKLESLFKASTPSVNYETLTILTEVDSNLESVKEYKLLDKDNKSVGKVTYDEGTRMLKAELNSGLDLERSNDLFLEFKATVNKDVIEDTDIKIQASATGTYSDNMKASKVESNEVVSTVLGGLSFMSAPATLDFGTLPMSNYKQKVGLDKSDASVPLLVRDTRVVRNKWAISAQMVTEMTNGTDVRPNTLKYVHKGKEKTLTDSPVDIYTNDGSKNDPQYNITDLWDKADLGEGLKFKIDTKKAPIVANGYKGKIKWVLRDTVD